eukprot:4518984-Karenia_brevis.AAC.1
MVLQIWEKVGDQINPVELQTDTGDFQYDVTRHMNNRPVITHKIETTCEVIGVRQCATCDRLLRGSM